MLTSAASSSAGGMSSFDDLPSMVGGGGGSGNTVVNMPAGLTYRGKSLFVWVCLGVSMNACLCGMYRGNCMGEREI